jgi:Cu/Ag efflux pump CusA
MFLTEPNRGDFLVKLKAKRRHSSDEVIAEFRHQFNEQIPALRWEFPGILTDLVGDLVLTPEPIEIKLFSPDLEWLRQAAPRVKAEILTVPGVVDVFDGLVETGPSINLRVRPADAARYGFNADDMATAVNTAMLGQTASSVMEGDRVVNIRVLVDPSKIGRIAAMRELLLRAPNGNAVKLSQLADIAVAPGQLELRREDLRQDVAITARLEGRDLGGAMAEIRAKLSANKWLPPGTVEYGGLYRQQQESFRNLLMVLLMAVPPKLP